ncbi:recombinase family protein [Pseudoalteromonas sp. CO342X]|uniref:recombinase family protein n=1 Tax=Pseudoalteromonas sp. CO342X TaxID=1777270 RepID=UPI001022A7C3|nr:recombinase family protein [Pseudoalteromonas sp. CO342X]RZG16721.1 recombinase family protein [Pseudoalteromonas sp. CO342X]
MRKAYLYQRFSSAAQINNSSEDRQLELQMEWLERNSDRAELAKSIFDEALSASKGEVGEHVAKGKLGNFLKALEDGKIERGSFLLIENISRLTRLNITSSQDLIRRFWDADITIVTVADGVEFEPQHGNDPITMSRLFFEIDRHHKEIQWHKKKISYSYQKRYKDFQQHGIVPKMRRPFWLDKNGKLNRYADSVKRMFELYCEGKGQVVISRTLKEEFPDYEPIQKMNPTTIIRWITSDIVKGVWRKQKMFDAAVDDSLYIEANTAHIERYNKHKSSNPKRTWPLSGLFRCGHCSSSRNSKENSGMSIQQTGNSLPVLRCSYRQRKASNDAACAAYGEPTTFPYILAHWFFVSVVQKKALLKYSSKNSDIELKKELQEINVEISKLQKGLDESRIEYLKLVKSGKAVKFVIGVISEIESQLDELSNKKSEVEYELQHTNPFIITPEASSLIDNVEKFNQAMRELDVKIFIKDRTLYYEGEKGYEYTRYCKKTQEFYYFDHVHMQRECPIPMKPDIKVLMMEKVLTRKEAVDSDNLDDSFLMQMF